LWAVELAFAQRNFGPGESGERWSSDPRQNPEDSDLIAGVELGATEAAFPGFQGKFTPLHLVERHFREETGHIGECKDGIEVIFTGFRDQQFYKEVTDTVGAMIG